MLNCADSVTLSVMGVVDQNFESDEWFLCTDDGRRETFAEIKGSCDCESVLVDRNKFQTSSCLDLLERTLPWIAEELRK